MLVKLQSAVSLLTCGCLVSLAASPSNIGFVVTSGQAQVDGSVVRGNSTLFQGSLVQAGSVTSDLMLPGGSNLLLQPGSAVKVYREYAVLQNGTATQRGSQGYALFADGLRVSSLSPAGAVVVGVQDRSHLEVAAQGAAAEVRNRAGVLVARLEPGKGLSFAIQAPSQGVPSPNGSQPSPASPASPQDSAGPAAGQNAGVLGPQLTIHGILRKDHAGTYGHFLLTDLATNVTYELQGSGLDDLVGGSVEATGSVVATTLAGASKTMYVSDIHQITIGEIAGNSPAKTPDAVPPTPSGDTPPASGAGPEVGATPEAKAPPEVSSEPTPPPLVVHSDTTKILVIVGIAAGAGVGVALGLAGGKSSTVSPE
jgi:hypothetical protein